MIYDELIKKVNMKNVIEGNITVFLRERINGKEDGAKMLASVIYNTMNKNYKGQDNFKLLERKIESKDDKYFESIATYALYVFAMQHTNKTLKNTPADPKKIMLIKVIANEITRGLDALNMYMANDIDSKVYNAQTEKTRKVMGISKDFHEALGEFLIANRSEIQKGISTI